MEFNFNINSLFPETITLITNDLLFNKRYNQKNSYHQKNLEYVIDELGKKSAKAQMLIGSITTLEKSLLCGHHIYVLKDVQANNGDGIIIGFIKVGKKRLFLLDRHGNQNEIYPLCVLDFYVHESQQRQGYGIRLFKHMLQNECVQPVHLAIDRPSDKFLSFLKKHYNMKHRIHQVNNFVIYEGFFDNRTDVIRTSVTNERFEKSRIRPLSRAVSDDVIRRHRETDNFLNPYHSRPISGYTTNQKEGFYGRNIRRRRWNIDGSLHSDVPPAAASRSNFYSRFAHEPIYTFNHRNSKPIKEINNEFVSKNDSKDFSSEGIKSTELNNKSEENVKNQIILHEHCEGVPNEEKQTKVFQTTKNPSSHLYDKPSDMLKELKEKDKKLLQENSVLSSPYRYQRRWQDHDRKTAWNIFGVPLPQYWTLK